MTEQATPQTAIQSYYETFQSPRITIGISGIIGAGKSTLAREICKKLGWDLIGEPVAENPYLTDFYADKAKYGFAMQLFLLHARFSQHQAMVWSGKSAVQDRTIYEDVIFAKMLFESGDISERDFNTYKLAFGTMRNFLHHPDVIIYLDVTPETALERVHKRGRACESRMPIEYLRALSAGYEDWVRDGLSNRIPVLNLDWNHPCTTDEVISKLLKIARPTVIV